MFIFRCALNLIFCFFFTSVSNFHKIRVKHEICAPTGRDVYTSISCVRHSISMRTLRIRASNIVNTYTSFMWSILPCLIILHVCVKETPRSSFRYPNSETMGAMQYSTRTQYDQQMMEDSFIPSGIMEEWPLRCEHFYGLYYHSQIMTILLSITHRVEKEFKRRQPYRRSLYTRRVEWNYWGPFDGLFKPNTWWLLKC